MREKFKFDPTRGTAKEQRERAYGTVGWWGVFPTSPCQNCGHEYFYPAGDWSMGYRCERCYVTWREVDANAG